MSDRLNRAAIRLAARMNACAASPVEYRRGGQIVATGIAATPGRTDYQQATDSGMVIGAQSKDFLILAEDLPVTPAVGDVVIVTGRKHEVNNLGNEACWRWDDDYHLMYRIHAKDVGAA